MPGPCYTQVHHQSSFIGRGMDAARQSQGEKGMSKEILSHEMEKYIGKAFAIRQVWTLHNILAQLFQGEVHLSVKHNYNSSMAIVNITKICMHLTAFHI